MRIKEKIILFAIIIIAFFFRFNNLNWDSDHHLHPDERFLTMVGNAMKIPANFASYLNPKTSTLNPRNIGFNFFVYGVFPVSLNKILAVLAGNDDYSMFTIQGRFLSALADLFVVILVYKTAKLLFKNNNTDNRQPITDVPLWSAFFYTISVLPIQLSHFFAVDTFLNLFMFASFYFMLRFWSRYAPQNDKGKNVILARSDVTLDRVQNLLFSAIFFGLALSSKITAVFIFPLILAFILKATRKKVHYFLFLTSCFLLLSYFTLR